MLYIYFENVVFQELAEELVVGFKLHGYHAKLTSEISTNTYMDLYIIFGMNDYSPEIVPHNYIVYQLEQTTGNDESKWFSERYLNYLRQAMCVWDYSLVNYQNLKKLGIKSIEYVPIQYLSQTDHIIQKAPSDKDIDIFFYGSFNLRRQKIIDDLRIAGLHVVARNNVWKQEREDLIARSKVVINIHYFEHSILETTRLSYLLSNNCLIVSEQSQDALLDKWHSKYLKLTSYNDLVSTCVDYIHAYNQIETSVQDNPTLITEITNLTYTGFDDYKRQTFISKVPILKLTSTYGYLMSKLSTIEALNVQMTTPKIDLPPIDSSDLFEAESEVNSQGEFILKLPKFSYDELPMVSVVTVTYNRRAIFPIAVRNWELFQYPRDKLEWIIVDDSDNGETLSDLLPKSKSVKYYKLETTGRLSIGQKRNFGVEKATHPYIINVDDDDYYGPLSVYSRIALLLKNPKMDLVGVVDLDIYDVVNDFSAKITKGAHVSEASMGFKKSFWQERQFQVKFNTLGEGYPFIKGRRDRVMKMPSCFNLIALTHWENYTKTNRSFDKFQNVEKKGNILNVLDLSTRLFILDLFDSIKKKTIK